MNGPDIRRLIADEQFVQLLSPGEGIAWNSIKDVIHNCLGIHRSENFRELIENMIVSFKNINVHMSLKIHFLHHHIKQFEKQVPTESDEHGERFHQVAAPLEFWYSGKKLNALLADLCWQLMDEN